MTISAVLYTLLAGAIGAGVGYLFTGLLQGMLDLKDRPYWFVAALGAAAALVMFVMSWTPEREAELHLAVSLPASLDGSAAAPADPTVYVESLKTEEPGVYAKIKASLREDSDIVLVGEMRDLETIQLALTAAETGLLVFGTLHTNNARKTVDRMVDVFPSDQQAQVRTMLANSLRGVVAQLLLKKSPEAGGGRMAVNEILIVNSAASAIIREGATQKLQDVIVGGKGVGMQFMDDAIWSIMQQGLITPLEAYMKAIDKNRFRVFLGTDADKVL